MKRIQALRNGYGQAIWFPEDVARLKQEIPELFFDSDYFVQQIYSYWSEDRFCAAWMTFSDWAGDETGTVIEQFAEYLREEVWE